MHREPLSSQSVHYRAASQRASKLRRHREHDVFIGCASATVDRCINCGTACRSTTTTTSTIITTTTTAAGHHGANNVFDRRRRSA